MTDSNTVEIIDREGWRKEVALTKAIISIGSDPHNDVVLAPARGSGVSPRHLQLIATGNGPGYRLINMGASEIRLGAAGESAVAPRAFADLGPGQQVRVGDFQLILHGGPARRLSEARDAQSAAIGLSLTLATSDLVLDRPLEGTITVQNLGEKTGVQIKLEVEGLDPACVELGPSPMLFPNAHKDVFIRVRHPRGTRPLAGDFRLRVRATAPAAYPGEVATASQLIQVMPYYEHKLRLRLVE